MNRANQIMDRMIEDLEKSAIGDGTHTFFSKFLDSLNVSTVLMKKLIEAHDAQILAAIDWQTHPDRCK
jgi:hypothetical protein